jgi:hypothetical protein
MPTCTPTAQCALHAQPIGSLVGIVLGLSIVIMSMMDRGMPLAAPGMRSGGHP